MVDPGSVFVPNCLDCTAKHQFGLDAVAPTEYGSGLSACSSLREARCMELGITRAVVGCGAADDQLVLLRILARAVVSVWRLAQDNSRATSARRAWQRGRRGRCRA